MALKPEPMEFEGEGGSILNQGQVYPMQLIQNETLISNIQLDAMSQSHTNTGVSSAIFPPNSDLGQNYAMDEEPGKVLSQHARQYSTVSEILLGGSTRQIEGRGKRFQNSSLQPYTIARGEMELNSKFLPKKYKCGMCVYKTSYKSDLNRHMRRHANNKEVPFCRECNLTFSSQSSLIIHNKKCPFRFSTEVDDQIQLRCEICPYATCYKSDLNRHMKCHYTYEFACDVCFKPFKILSTVDNHRQNAHDIQATVLGEGGLPAPHALNPYRQGTWTGNDNTGQIQEDSINGTLRKLKRRSDNLSYKKPSQEIAIHEECVLIDDSPNESLSVTQSSVEQPESDVEGSKSASDTTPALVRSLSSEAEKQNPEDGEINRCSTPDSASKTQLQKQSRVRELLSLNSGKQSTVTLSIKQFCCEKCNGIFASIKELLHHKKMCLKGESSCLYKCTFCIFQTFNNLTFKRHKRKHTAASYSCECCNHPFMIERNLIKHKHFCRWSTSKLFTGKKENVRNRTQSSDAILERNETSLKNSVMHGTNNAPTKRYHSEADYSQFETSRPGEILNQPPERGRFARLISDFDEFSRKPYACALCFFRTADTGHISKHIENHLTGCNIDPIPESSRFRILQQHTCLTRGPNVAPKSVILPVETVVTGITNLQSRKESFSETAPRRQNMTPNVIVCAKTRYHMNPALSFQSSAVGTTRSRPGRRPKLARAFACHVCGKQFSVRLLLVRHLKNIHKDDMETE